MIKLLQMTKDVNLDKETQHPDDAALVMIGGAIEDNEATPAPLAADLKIATLLTYLVPAGKKAIVIKVEGDKTAIGTDKNSTFQICDNVTSKVEVPLASGYNNIVKEYPIHDYEFAAGVTIKLQAVTEAGAIAIFYAMKVTLLILNA